MEIELGYTYKDLISEFEGVATGYVKYLTGCNQALITPRGDGEARWFDVQRLVRVKRDRIVLDNSRAPGCDIPAPIR